MSGRRRLVGSTLFSAQRRWFRQSPRAWHDHSKDDEFDFLDSDRPEDWWPKKPKIKPDAPIVYFTVELASGKSSVELSGRQGETVMDVCKREGLMEAACDGHCQCSTCHVFVLDEMHRGMLGMPDTVEDFEFDMLELAAKFEENPAASRLACQIDLTVYVNGLVVRLPDKVINYMDDIPFD